MKERQNAFFHRHKNRDDIPLKLPALFVNKKRYK